jgi:hypothetical protein
MVVIIAHHGEESHHHSKHELRHHVPLLAWIQWCEAEQ